jgi:hypothetical protein
MTHNHRDPDQTMPLWQRSAPWWGNAVRGALAGAAATWLMDLVTSGLLEGQSEETTRREMAAQPNGKGSVANLVDRIDAAWGLELDDRQRSMAAQAIHYGLGIIPGAAYGVLRNRVPILRSGRGLAYGILLWAVNDEYLNTKLGLAGPFGAYPLETHWRGLVGHAVLGVATDTGLDLLGG